MSDARKPTNRALVAVAHGRAYALYFDIDDDIEQRVADIGTPQALEEALADLTIADGVWVLYLRLADDGPGDAPGYRECKLSASGVRAPTAEEWSHNLDEEHIWWTP